MVQRKEIAAVIVLFVVLFSSVSAMAAEPKDMKQHLKDAIAAESGVFQLNMWAYTDITFAQMFGNEVEYTETGDLSPAVMEAKFGQSLATLFTLIRGNIKVAPVKDGDSATLAKKDEIVVLLDKLIGEILPLVPDDKGSPMGSWRFRKFCEADVENSYSGNEKVKALFENFAALKNAGFALPLLSIKENNGFNGFKELVHGTRFLERMTRITYPDFFFYAKDNPLVDDELLDIVDDMNDAGMLVAFAVKPDGFKPANYYRCCTKTTPRTCTTSASPTSQCTQCVSSCCLGSTTCP